MREFTGLISTGFPLIHLTKHKTYAVTLNRQWMVLNFFQPITLSIEDCVMHETLVSTAIVLRGEFFTISLLISTIHDLAKFPQIVVKIEDLSTSEAVIPREGKSAGFKIPGQYLQSPLIVSLLTSTR